MRWDWWSRFLFSHTLSFLPTLGSTTHIRMGDALSVQDDEMGGVHS